MVWFGLSHSAANAITGLTRRHVLAAPQPAVAVFLFVKTNNPPPLFSFFLYKFEKQTPNGVWPESDFVGRRTKTSSSPQITEKVNETAHEPAPMCRRYPQSTKIHDGDDDGDEFCGATTRPREAFTVCLWWVRGHYVYRRAVWLLCLSPAGVGGQRRASLPPESSATCDRTETLTASRLIPPSTRSGVHA